MSVGRKMPLQEAQEIAAYAYAGLERHCRRLVVAGSIRRERRFCSDIEIVLEPHMQGSLFGEQTPLIEPIHNILRQQQGRWVKGGSRYIQIADLFGQEGVKLDVFLVHPPSQWGSIVAIRTGPFTLSKYCVTKMRSRGFRHRDGHAVSVKTGALVPTPNEDDFFELAGVPIVAPPLRGQLARRVGAT